MVIKQTLQHWSTSVINVNAHFLLISMRHILHTVYMNSVFKIVQ